VRCTISSRSKTTQSGTSHVPKVSAAPRVDILLLAWLLSVWKTVWLLDKAAQLHTVCLCHTTCQVFEALISGVTSISKCMFVQHVPYAHFLQIQIYCWWTDSMTGILYCMYFYIFLARNKIILFRSTIHSVSGRNYQTPWEHLLG